VRVAQYVANFIATVNPRVYGVCGAGAMWLNDAIAHHDKIEWMATHHEQAAVFAAEADARVSGKPGIVHVTSGPGITNVMTGVACAWADSIPLIVIAGQAETRTLSGGVRQLGVSEVDGEALMAPITKFTVSILSPYDIRRSLEKALHFATTGRPGPVYIEIPLDIQAQDIDPSTLSGWQAPVEFPQNLRSKVRPVLDDIAHAKRPVLIIGNGVRLAGAASECVTMANRLNIPTISSWNASDIFNTDATPYIGRCGLFGDRGSNFAVQNADLIVAIGNRFSIPQVGHNSNLFAPNAKKIVVDIDAKELRKFTVDVDFPIVADAKDFILAMLEEIGKPATPSRSHYEWLERCWEWKQRYPVVTEDQKASNNGINSYAFIDVLCKSLPDDAIVVTDVGTAFVTTMQAMRFSGNQRLFHSSGIAPMGWGLPAAIGAYRAGGGRKVILIAGDGGMMFNMQELATVAHHNLPITMFVYANGGYLTMRHTQDTHFKRRTLADTSSGVTCADFVSVARAFGIEAMDVHSLEPNEYWSWLDGRLNNIRPALYQLRMQQDQAVMPRVQSKLDGTNFVPVALDDMFPYLDRDVLEKERAA